MLDRIGSNDQAPCKHPNGHCWSIPYKDGNNLRRDCLWCPAALYEANPDALADFRFITPQPRTP